MIDTNLIQAALVAKLKANNPLITWLTQFSTQSEVREAQFQGREFLYPCVRVQLGTQVEIGDPPCFSTIPFTIYSYSEYDSSMQANELAGYVTDAMLRGYITDTTWHSGIIAADGMIPALRTSERVWQAINQYHMNVYGGVL